MTRLLKLNILLLILLVAGCGAKKNDSVNETAGNNAETADTSGDMVKSPTDQPNSQSSGIPVEVTPITRGDISSFLLYNSTMETEQMADVFSRISGLVEKLYVEEAQTVKKNQPMVQLEQDEYILEEEKAKLQYDKSQSEFKRFEALKEKNLISQEEFENARLSLRQAELQWKQAKLNLDYTIVRSPINGVIGERLVQVGDRIQPATRLFSVSNMEDKVVRVFVPQDELRKCYLNQPATITSEVLPNREFVGWVKRISPIVDPTSGTFKVTVGVKDPQNALHPGLFVSAKLIVDTHKDAMLIPKTALVYENERTYIFSVVRDSVQKIELEKGFEDAQKVELLNPLADTTSIVVVGQDGLNEGNKVKIIRTREYDWQKMLNRTVSQNSGSKANLPSGTN